MPDTLINDLTYIQSQIGELKAAVGVASNAALSSLVPAVDSLKANAMVPAIPSIRSDWLAFPTLIPGTQVCHFLLVLQSDLTIWYIPQDAINVRIDWGDGASSNSGTQGVSISHTYSYSSISSTLTTEGYKQVLIAVTPPANNLAYIPQFRPLSSAGGWYYSQASVPIVRARINATTIYGGDFTNYHHLVVAEIFENNLTNFSNMFSGCSALTTIPLLDTSNSTNFGGTFANCYALTTIPLLNTSKSTNFSDMFSGCSSLTSIPLLDTSKSTTFSGMFANCYALTTIPLLDTSKGTDFGGTFANCYALTTIPLLNTSKSTNFSNMFSGCYALTTIPLLDTSKGTDFDSMVNSCFSLTTIPALVTTAETQGFGYLFYLVSLTSINAVLRDSVYFYYCGLGHDAIVAIFNNLPVMTGKTIGIATNTAGGSALTAPEIAIATNKGWTVV